MINADEAGRATADNPTLTSQQLAARQQAHKLAVAKERLKWAQFRLNMFVFLFIVDPAPVLISFLLRSVGLNVPQLHGYIITTGPSLLWIVLVLYAALIGFSLLARRAAAGQFARLQAAQEQQANG